MRKFTFERFTFADKTAKIIKDRSLPMEDMDMKYTTPALINNTRKLKGLKAFFIGQASIASYYQARHKHDDVFLLWIEASQFGKLQCFPCVLEESGDAMVFEVMKGLDAKARNASLVQRWGLFATPENIREEFEITEMEKNEFYQLFGDYRKGAVQHEIAHLSAPASPSEAEKTETAPPEAEKTETAQPEAEKDAEAKQPEAEKDAEAEQPAGKFE